MYHGVEEEIADVELFPLLEVVDDTVAPHAQRIYHHIADHKWLDVVQTPSSYLALQVRWKKWNGWNSEV